MADEPLQDSSAVGPCPSREIPEFSGSRRARREAVAEPARLLLPLLRENADAVRIDGPLVALFSSAAARFVLPGDLHGMQVDGLAGPDPRVDPNVRAEWLESKRSVQANLSHLSDHRLHRVVGRALEEFSTADLTTRNLLARCQRLSASIMTELLLPGASAAVTDVTAAVALTQIESLRRPSRKVATRLADEGRQLRSMVEHHAEKHELPFGLVDSFGQNRATRTLTTVLAGTHTIPGTSLAWLLAQLSIRDTRNAIGTVREVLRLYPPAWLLARKANEDKVIDGWRVRSDDTVHVSPYLVHHDPRNWNRPEEFDPDRWSDPNVPRQHYIPFGTGPRVCPAINLSERIMVTVCESLSGRLPQPLAVRPEFGTLLTPVPVSPDATSTPTPILPLARSLRLISRKALRRTTSRCS